MLARSRCWAPERAGPPRLKTTARASAWRYRRMVADIDAPFGLVSHGALLAELRYMPLCIVVDDHVDTREGFAEYLRDSGFDVRAAGDAPELRALLAEM